MIRYTLAQVLRIEGVFMLLPCIVALIYREQVGIIYLFIALTLMVLGTIGSLFKPKDTVIYLKEGCVATSLSWIVMSLGGCLPFFISGEIPSFTDALLSIPCLTDILSAGEWGSRTCRAAVLRILDAHSPTDIL